ncbi:hypothetical protein BABINDRAFT_60810 [Babjeviella inositovora NRRL Y-12698]|uniref:Uncharacterized protein n=1 Tax=Babjeviella inositovora NRRL Y-12698 TaxID=984486 RepID=A0A1E3QUW4_9ASCO|nr:uncharacterized protein BABINDRAFT_60810 [Babjeviella inositovora NRRL Y-12698]ODQ80747.1 hypothetical protein BABINDRAFT_60810 [Babjeviella inositovora NRRL Y-12698]
MGVTSLWDIIGPSARPVRLEALSRKRLAVDASIWIYQFLKAVRDKDGRAMKNAHIVGFFRRICKLLYFGILPVFVFDGAVHPLKKKTILERKNRREGQRANAKTTAEKLLAIQLQKLAEKNYILKSPQKNKTSLKKEVSMHPIPYRDTAPMVYFEDLVNHQKQENANSHLPTDEEPPNMDLKKPFRKVDEYQLPEIDGFRTSLSDTRVLTEQEYTELTAVLDDHIDGIDLRTVDPSSQEFAELRLETQYMILSNLRIRSRLRMGFSKTQLETLFPNSMDFSRFQIQMVQKRNYLTQRLMSAAGMDSGVAADGTQSRRIAGEKDRSYMLHRVDNGYALSIDSEAGTSTGNAIVLDEVKEEEEESDIDWEDVPTEPGPQKPATDLFDSGSNLLDANSGSLYALSNPVLDAFHDVDAQLHRRRLYQQDLELSATLLQSEVEAIDKVEMEHVIELSKQDLLRKLSKLQMLKSDAFELVAQPVVLQGDLKCDPAPAFSFGASSLFGSRPTLAVPKTDFEIPQLSTDANEKPTPTTPHRNVADKPVKAPPPTMPSWFDNSLSFNPYSDYNMTVADKPQLSETADELAGLVSWEKVESYLNDERNHRDFRDGELHRNIKSESVKGASNTQLQIAQSNYETIARATATDMPIPIDERGRKQEDSIKATEHLLNRPESTDIKVNTDTPQNVSTTISSPLVPDSADFDYEFSDNELMDLEVQLQNEEAAYDTFRTTLNPNTSTISSTAITNLDLLHEQRKAQLRDSDSPTQTMILDVQELLMRFGIPFITAPTEAESQCCELLKLGLVDGIVTDDSDVFLFGGDTVYRNMFSDGKYVECYFMSDIERDVGLTQANLINLALLLGSDYTEGLKGVGKVMAMEILAEFASTGEGDDTGPLVNFRNWWRDIQNGRQVEDEPTVIRKKLKKVFQKLHLHLTDSFPPKEVAQAYLFPEVDHDKAAFKWGTPDLDRLRTFLMYNAGWSQAKVDEVLVPLIKDINKKKTEGVQSTLGEFYPREVISRKEISRGKRLKQATDKLSKKQKKS